MIRLVKFIDFIGLFVLILWRIRSGGYISSTVVSVILSLVIVIIINKISKSSNHFISLLGWLFFDAITFIMLAYGIRFFTQYIGLFSSDSKASAVIALVLSFCITFMFEALNIHYTAFYNAFLADRKQLKTLAEDNLKYATDDFGSLQVRIKQCSDKGKADELFKKGNDAFRNVFGLYIAYDELKKRTDPKPTKKELKEATNAVVAGYARYTEVQQGIEAELQKAYSAESAETGSQPDTASPSYSLS